jgi:hypothetical protein
MRPLADPDDLLLVCALDLSTATQGSLPDWAWDWLNSYHAVRPVGAYNPSA